MGIFAVLTADTVALAKSVGSLTRLISTLHTESARASCVISQR